MSFFDEDDEPRRTPRSRRRASSGNASTDQQTLLIRRAVAIGGAVVILILLVVAVNGCLDSRKKNALKDYNREVASIASESERQTGAEFFNLLRKRGNESPQDLQTAISGFRTQAETQLKQAEDLSVPGEMEPAQRSLLIALQFRRDGLGFIAERIRTALGDQAETADEAINLIAGQMQAFLASDVVYSARVGPLIRGALDKAEVGGQQVAGSKFLPGVQWIDPQFVGDALGQQVSGGSNPSRRPVQPGLHGTSLESVAVGDTRLQPSPAPNRIPAATDTGFLVRFTNGGEFDELDVKVTVTVKPEQGKAITKAKTIDTVKQGATAEADIPLGQRPPLGAATVTVTVDKVPGEENVDNNKSEYDVGFVAQ